VSTNHEIKSVFNSDSLFGILHPGFITTYCILGIILVKNKEIKTKQHEKLDIQAFRSSGFYMF
jgi:hypothetical protein